MPPRTLNLPVMRMKRGAQRDHLAMAENLKKALQDALKQLTALPVEALLAQRYERLMSYGRFKEQAA